MPTLTIFSAPKAFVGPAAVNQRNAVWSWTQLGPDVEVILIGDEEGIESTSGALGTRHIAEVARSPAGVPLLDDLFRIGQAESRADLCMFVNADIVIGPDLLAAVKRAAAWADRFLLVGQRWDTPVDRLIEHDGPTWWEHLRTHALAEGRLNSPLWIDYFAFPRGQYEDLPPFVIGRPGYDNWIVWHTCMRDVPVIDASDSVVAIHQRHAYSQYGGTKAHIWSEDSQSNADLIGDRRKLFTIGHATNRMTGRGIERARGPKYTAARLYTRARPVIDSTAAARHRVGFNAELVQRLASPLRRRQQRRQG